MWKPTLVALSSLVLFGCGSFTGASSGPAAPEPSPSVTPSDPETARADSVGDSLFYIDEVVVRVAESFPVQLFLDVTGNAPTPCHGVTYLVEPGPERIEVTLTTQSSPEPCATVLDPRAVVIPLGSATLPVRVDVNDGEFAQTVRP